MTALFVFHNDLRLDDNTALIEAVKQYKVIPIFIFDSRQLSNSNKYRGERSIQFMHNCLIDLDSALHKHSSHLHCFAGITHVVIGKLLRENKDIEAVFSNCNYTPFAIERDKEVNRVCEGHKVNFIIIEDYCLHPLLEENSLTKYKKFTPYYTAASKRSVAKPMYGVKLHFANKKLKGEVSIDLLKKLYNADKQILVGGRSSGIKRLKQLSSMKKYNANRNKLTFSTSALSAYIKFGCLSIREIYHHAKKYNVGSDFIKQLYWRDFYIALMFSNPQVVGKGNRNLQSKYSNVKWRRYSSASQNEKKWFLAWCKGQTGYPIVDACMRQLNETGYMHNRGRLIVAGFLCKILGWHWMDGEKYFAIKLTDYDVAQNNGNWQFVAGSGVDVQPYFRIFNPWRQGANYDKAAGYIKKWVPELKSCDAKILHTDTPEAAEERHKKKYPKPIVDYVTYRDKTKKMYKAGLSTGVQAK